MCLDLDNTTIDLDNTTILRFYPSFFIGFIKPIILHLLNYTCYSGFTQLYLLFWIYSIILVILDLLNYTCYSAFTQLYLLFWIYSIILVILDFLSGFASKLLFQNVMSLQDVLMVSI